MVAAWARTREAGIPFDVQWGDIDYMDRRLDFTVDQDNFAGLADFVAELHEMGMRFRIRNSAYCNKVGRMNRKKVCADPGPRHLQRGASRQLPRLRGGGEARGVAAELQRAAAGGPGEDRSRVCSLQLCQVWVASMQPLVSGVAG